MGNGWFSCIWHDINEIFPREKKTFSEKDFTAGVCLAVARERLACHDEPCNLRAKTINSINSDVVH